MVFKKVKFKYEETSVFHNLNLKLEAGKKYAFVGESGSGKSTLTNLICKFCQPDDGVILINQYSLKDLGCTNCRQQVSLVAQETFLFNNIVSANIECCNYQKKEK